MPCFHPMTIYRSLLPDASGKFSYNFKPEGRCVHPMKIPCGQCIGCRLEYSRQWAVRCCLESKQHDHTWFVTLTYDNEHLPVRDHVKCDPVTGEVVFSEQVATLRYRDLTLFLKKLRQQLARDGKPGFRYYGCGDYGTKNGRPHYHLIMFGLQLDDLRFCSWQKKSEAGFPLFESPWLSDKWHYGLVAVGEFNFDTAAYTARYVTRKQTGRKKDYYANLGIEPIKSVCSRRPGIAADFARKNAGHILDFDKVTICRADGKGYSVKPPAYFDRLFDIDPDLTQKVNENKRSRIASGEQVEASYKRALDIGSLKHGKFLYDDYLIKCEDSVLMRTKALKRSLENGDRSEFGI